MFLTGSTWQLSKTSPCINKGFATPPTSTLGFTVSQDYLGLERGLKKDIGAHEVAGYTRYGEGCPGTGNKVPTMSVGGNVWPGDQISLKLLDGKASSPLFIAAGAPRTIINVGGKCNLLVNPLLVLTATTTATGDFKLKVTIPSNTAVLGLSVYAQMAVADAAAGGLLGVAFTNGVDIKL